MIEEFLEREPIWGWRDDSLAVMERQIDLAADHGVNFFAFCWYRHDNGKAMNEQAILADPLHTGLELFLRAKNRHRLTFCLLVANHGGFEIKGTTNWTQAADYRMPYLTNPQYLTIAGKPLVIVFHPQGGDQAGFDYLQGAARKAGLSGVALAGCGGGSAEMGYTHRTHYNIIPGYSAGPENIPNWSWRTAKPPKEHQNPASASTTYESHYWDVLRRVIRFSSLLVMECASGPAAGRGVPNLRTCRPSRWVGTSGPGKAHGV